MKLSVMHVTGAQYRFPVEYVERVAVITFPRQLGQRCHQYEDNPRDDHWYSLPLAELTDGGEQWFLQAVFTVTNGIVRHVATQWVDVYDLVHLGDLVDYDDAGRVIEYR